MKKYLQSNRKDVIDTQYWNQMKSRV